MIKPPVPSNGTADGTPERRPRLTPAARAARNAEIFDLAVMGTSVRTLADNFGISKSTAARVVANELRLAAESRRESVAEMVELENARLDEMERSILPLALIGDLRSAAMVLKIMERRARLNGLDRAGQVSAVNDDRPVEFVIQVLDSMMPAPMPTPPELEG